MQNLTLGMKQALQTFCEAGGTVYEIAYDPTTVGTLGGSSNPEVDFGAGLVEYYREDTVNLVEVIYKSQDPV